MKTQGKVIGIDFKEGTKQDGTKWIKYSYGIDLPGVGKRFFSAWQKYDVQLGQDVAIDYEETLNQKNLQFPFKNIKSMAVIVPSVQQSFPGVNIEQDQPKQVQEGITPEFVQGIKPAYKAKVPQEQQNENHFVSTVLRTYAKTHSETLAKKLDMIVQVYNTN